VASGQGGLDNPGRTHYKTRVVLHRNLSLPPGYPARDQSTYAGFRTALADSRCILCPLSSGRTRIVVDRGAPGARLMAVGEAPGAEEDRTGRAFVGRSGRFLDEMLHEAGLDPERDLLIANVVKCRPPGNRPPLVEEARRCLPFLRRQIELLRPRILVLLGATPSRYLLPGESPGPLAKRVGRFFRRPEYPRMDLMVLFHPAYVLRNRRLKPEMVRHLAKVRQRLAEVVREGIALN
jgi:uracil-DNA glycosylase